MHNIEDAAKCKVLLEHVSVSPISNTSRLHWCLRATLETLLKKEIAPYPIPHQAELEGQASFKEGGADLADHWKSTLHTRINQHNIRVASKYYRRIHGSRLAELLGLSLAELEMEISDMVSEGSVYAKIDRPKDIIRFASSKTPEAVLTEWSGDISELLELVEKTTHLIHKEMTVQ
jgi:26S proteasome regulatory subunit N5